jgi:hypothetical protein
MSRILVLGDTHGHDSWKAVVNHEDFDKVIFLGDYLDSFTVKPEVIANNFCDLLNFKQSMGDKCKLLYGNHDHSYWNAERCSGYKFHAVSMYMPLLEDAFKESLIDLIHIEGDIIFSHAGVSEYWLKKVAMLESVHDINFNTIVNLDILNWNMMTGYDGYGNTISQSPIWIRPQSLLKSKVDGYRQIVGHTNMGTPVDEQGLYFNDLLPDYYIIVEDGDIKFVENKFK